MEKVLQQLSFRTKLGASNTELANFPETPFLLCFIREKQQFAECHRREKLAVIPNVPHLS